MKLAPFRQIVLGATVCAAAAACGSTPGEPPVTPAPPEVSIAFRADRTELAAGECTVLIWQVEGGFGVVLDGRPVQRAGTLEVCPVETTRYRLSVDAGTHLEEAEAEVIIAQAEPDTSTPPPGQEVSVTAGLEYGFYEMEASHFPLVLDLYRPSGVAQPSPLLVFIHGGGWIEGSREDCPGEAFARYGYAVACVDYRLASLSGQCWPETTFPAQIHDVRAAVRWLRRHAFEYSLDGERIARSGAPQAGIWPPSWGCPEGWPSSRDQGTREPPAPSRPWSIGSARWT